MENHLKSLKLLENCRRKNMNSLLEVHGEKNLFSFGNTEAKKKKTFIDFSTEETDKSLGIIDAFSFFFNLYSKVLMTIENLNFLCTMAFYSDETKFYRVILNTGERKKKKKKTFLM